MPAQLRFALKLVNLVGSVALLPDPANILQKHSQRPQRFQGNQTKLGYTIFDQNQIIEF